MTPVFQLSHLPINHRQIRGPDRSTNFSSARCNLYCSTLNLSATKPSPFLTNSFPEDQQGTNQLVDKIFLPDAQGEGMQGGCRRIHQRENSIFSIDGSALRCHSPDPQIHPVIRRGQRRKRGLYTFTALALLKTEERGEV